MNSNRQLVLSTVLGLVVALVTSLMVVQVGAQDGSDPTPTPPVEDENVPEFYAGEPTSEGDAEWTVTDFYYESNYPRGFTFRVDVESTGGPITSARVFWSHTPGQRKSKPAEYDPESGTAELVHITGTGESVPAWVAVNYRWSFEDEAGNTYLTQWILGEEYEDNSKEWMLTESDDILVFAEEGLPDTIGEQVVEAMAAQRETFRLAWGDVLPYRPRAILYSSRDSFTEWRVGESNPAVIGTTSDDWGGTVQVVSSGDVVDLAWGTVLHEVAHLYQSEFAGAFATGTWWNEGNATLFELNQQYDYEQRVRNAARNGTLRSVLVGPGPGASSTGPDGGNRWGYDVGYSFWKWVVETYGLDTHRQIIQAWRRGGTRNGVLEEVLGAPIEDIELEWRLWLGASGSAPTPVPTPTFPFPPTPTRIGS